MDEKQELLDIIDNYINELQIIKSTIDQEIKETYFRFSCIGSNIECEYSYLFKKYHRINRDKQNG